MDEDWVVLRQVLHLQVKEKNGLTCLNRKKAGQRVAATGKVAWRKPLIDVLLSATKGQETVFNKRSALSESLLNFWNENMHKRYECVKIGKIKSKYLKLCTYRLTPLLFW